MMSPFCLLVVVTTLFFPVANCLRSDCSLIQCFPPECKPGEKIGPVPEGACCPGCVPDRCATVRCALPICKQGFIPQVPLGECCPVCAPDCSKVLCALPLCKKGFTAQVPKGQCCPICLPDCSAVSCLKPSCKPRQKLEVPEGECCPVCIPDCSAITCLRPTCKPGQKLEVPEGECCPVCVPDCSAVSCLRPTCKSGEKLEVPMGECCAVCVPDLSKCAAVSCILPICQKGEKAEVPKGECCPVCVPDCSSVSCLRPVCKRGERLKVPAGECCPICMRECKISGQTLSDCASSCPATCDDPNPVCIALCVQGCKCPPGQVIDSKNRRCIPPQFCPPKDEKVCALPAKVGPCDGAFTRYFYNSKSRRCEQFTFGGCGGNSNNFKTKASCKSRCSGRIKKCFLPPETGPCKALIPRFFHNSTSGRCEKFIFGGCLGNSNNFRSRSSCNKQCGRARCSLLPETGPCKALIQRYFHNTTSRKCERFTYGGCEGNSNNFIARDSCEQACGVRVDRCELPPETGPCRAAFPRYFHNSTSRKCERFTFGGCGGNRNKFRFKETCEKACNVRVNRCSLPPKTGPCRARFTRYFHNSTTRRCERFTFGGCKGNSNNFRIRERCEKVCDVPSPCATILCPNGFRCKVLNGEGFCTPDCSLNNGGCLANQTCRLEDVVCVRAPCPPARICEDLSPCATVRCANGFRCKVFNGEAFCDPDCKLNNGGCEKGQTCSLKSVTCVREPCPPARICTCPPQCSVKFCRKNKNAICSNPGPREIPGCTGSCQLTYCRACYFSPHLLPLPGNCKQCDLADYRSNTSCFRRWSKCIQKAHFKENGWTYRRRTSDFRCYSPECPLRG